MEAYHTAEVRWFAPGAIPQTVRAWFGSLGPDLEAERRTDLYLEPTSNALGVKVREGRVEAKRRMGTLGHLALEGLDAEIETWAKWSFETPTVLEGDGWIEVAKTRWQRHAEGCALELSEIVLEDATWWSVCLEATGPHDGARRSALEDGARRWLSLEVAAVLRGSSALGYPAWLGTVRG